MRIAAGFITALAAALFLSGCQEGATIPIDSATPSALGAPAQSHSFQRV